MPPTLSGLDREALIKAALANRGEIAQVTSAKQVTELEKKLGPEYIALVNDLNNVDPNSPEGREIDSILAPLEDSCED